MSDTPESLRYLGQGKNPPYTLHSESGEIPARFSFDGLLQGTSTRWTATLWPLADYPLPHPCDDTSCQFMQIGERRSEETPITIALNLSKIDEGALLKTLVMIRKYKRLRPGLICFGAGSPSVD